jgi:hypothetical protein
VSQDRLAIPYSISPLQMGQTIAMFEAIVKSVETGQLVEVPH